MTGQPIHYPGKPLMCRSGWSNQRQKLTKQTTPFVKVAVCLLECLTTDQEIGSSLGWASIQYSANDADNTNSTTSMTTNIEAK